MKFVHGHNRRKPKITPSTKLCGSCGRRRKAAAFYADKTKPDGLSSYCKECRKARASDWYRSNPERAKEARERWRQENPERYAAAKMRWQKAHPKERLEIENRRRVRLRSGVVEKIDVWTIYERDGGRCHICGKRVAKRELSLDHLIPVSKGGPHVATNVRIAHRLCNVRRGVDRIPAQLLLH